MPESSTSHKVRQFRFGAFELDMRLGVLRRDGEKLALPSQAMQILEILVSSPKQLVTREQLRQALWPDGTFVVFDDVLNQNIRRLRRALEDDADVPRFIETLPRRGYRFIAVVEGDITAANQPVELPPPAKSGRLGRPFSYKLAILSAIIIAVGGLALWKPVFLSHGTPKVLRFRKLTDDGQVKVGPMFSDGVRVYFNEVLPDGRSIIVQVSVKGGEAIPLPVPLISPGVLDISKDGTELLVANAEVNGHISIWVQSVAGGSLHRVGTLFEGNNIDSASAAFSSDGTGIIYGQGHDVYLMKRDGSSSQRLLTVDNTPHWFRFSPDARTLRFSQWDPNGPMNTLMSANADGKELQKMLKACCGDWTPDGRFFVFLRTVDDHTNFWTLRESKRFSWRKHKDEPSQLTAGPLDFGYPLPGKDGKEIFAIGYNPRAEVIRWDAHIHEFVPYFSGISADGLAFSLDGQWVAYTSYPDGILWLSRVDGSERLQLTSPPLKVLIPRWSPDGRQIAFNAALPRQPWNIYVISKAGGSAERVLPNDQGQKDANWSPDGKSLIFGSAHDPKGSISIFETGSKHVATLPGSRGFFSPRWSPDGKYISAIVTETRKLMLFDVSAQRWTEVSDANVGNSMWSHDGKYLYYQDYSPQDSNYQIVRLRATNRQIEKIVDTNAVGRATTGADGQWFGLTPDDSPLLARDIGTQEIYAIDVEWP